jgi:hypothetical protein
LTPSATATICGSRSHTPGVTASSPRSPRPARAWGRRFTAAHGEPERYHETLTTAWARVVAAHAVEHPDAGFDAFLAAHPQLLRRDLLLGHYSRERLYSEPARARFVDPDLVALP